MTKVTEGAEEVEEIEEEEEGWFRGIIISLSIRACVRACVSFGKRAGSNPGNGQILDPPLQITVGRTVGRR